MSAEELALAATRSRCMHRYLARPDGTVGQPSDCTKCGIAYSIALPPSRKIAVPLGALLVEAATLSKEHRPDPAYDGDGHQWCHECQVEDCGPLLIITRALAIARAINGSTP